MVEEYHQMVPHASFRHITIQACWPTSAEDLDRCVLQVTPKGRSAVVPRLEPPTAHEFAASLTPHGILQVCLLCTEPFQGCGSDQIRLIPLTGPKKPIPCPDRPLLVESIAEALLQYEKERRQLTEAPEVLQQATVQSLQLVGTMVLNSLYWRSKKRHRGPTSSQHAKTLNDAYRMLATEIASLTIEDYVQLSHKSSICSQMLTIRMAEAFTRHGPLGYGRVALSRHIATIVRQLKIKDGTLLKVSQTVRQRINRYEKRMQSQPSQDG